MSTNDTTTTAGHRSPVVAHGRARVASSSSTAPTSLPVGLKRPPRSDRRTPSSSAYQPGRSSVDLPRSDSHASVSSHTSQRSIPPGPPTPTRVRQRTSSSPALGDTFRHSPPVLLPSLSPEQRPSAYRPPSRSSSRASDSSTHKFMQAERIYASSLRDDSESELLDDSWTGLPAEEDGEVDEHERSLARATGRLESVFGRASLGRSTGEDSDAEEGQEILNSRRSPRNDGAPSPPRRSSFETHDEAAQSSGSRQSHVPPESIPMMLNDDLPIIPQRKSSIPADHELGLALDWNAVLAAESDTIAGTQHRSQPPGAEAAGSDLAFALAVPPPLSPILFPLQSSRNSVVHPSFASAEDSSNHSTEDALTTVAPKSPNLQISTAAKRSVTPQSAGSDRALSPYQYDSDVSTDSKVRQRSRTESDALKAKGSRPMIRQKSLKRPPSTSRIASSDSQNIPVPIPKASPSIVAESEDTVPSERPAEVRLRPRENNPLSASDFGDIYATFGHDRSRPSSSALFDVSSLPSPPLPPLPFSSAPSSPIPPVVDILPNGVASPAPPTLPEKHNLKLLSASASHARNPSAALSDGSGETSVYHDAPLTHLSGDRLPTTKSSDAKSKAAAFVADLRRARLEAASSSGRSASSDVDSDVGSQQERTELSRKTEKANDEDRPSNFGSSSNATTEARPTAETPSSPPRVQSEGLLASVPTRPATRGSPRPPVSPSTSFADFSRSPSLMGFATSADYDKLISVKDRVLPRCVHSNDVRRLRTSGERAQLYAQKLNALAREDSGAGAWIAVTRKSHGRGPNDTASTSGSPNRLGHVRNDASTATFPSRQDGYKARELSQGAISPRDLIPNTPFPGVLHLTRNAKSSTTLPKNLMALGRKASRRAQGSPFGQTASPPTARLSGNPPLSSDVPRSIGPRRPRNSIDGLPSRYVEAPTLTQRASFNPGSYSGQTLRELDSFD